MSVKVPRPDLAALALCALIVLAITGLAIVGKSIPDVLPYLATAALSAGAGLSLNSPGTIGTETIRRSSSSAPTPRSAPTGSPAPASRPAPPADALVTPPVSGRAPVGAP